MLGGTHPSREAPCSRRQWLPWLSCALALAALAIAPGSAGAVKLGTPSFTYDDNDGGVSCGSPSATCIYMQRKLPGATLRAPFSGTIRKWRVASSSPRSFELIVMRKEGDGSFKAVRGSDGESVPALGVYSFKANLRIRQGDRVGIFTNSMQIATNPDAVRVRFNPPPILGGSATPGPATPNELLYSATLKP